MKQGLRSELDLRESFRRYHLALDYRFRCQQPQLFFPAMAHVSNSSRN